jgi:hypothetical protein
VVLLSLLPAFATGCDDAEPPTTEPAYARPTYATLPGREVETAMRFEDVTTASGITFVHETGAFGEKWMPETMGSGAAFFDYDTDGWPDLLLVNGAPWPGRRGTGATPYSRLYRNLGNGRFEDVTEEAGLALPLYGMGVTAADYDADGDPDLYLTAVGTNRLLRNDGGRFTDVTMRTGAHGNSGMPGDPPSWSTGAAWVDTDRDGWLDLFVCNYVRWTPKTDLFTTLDGTNKSYATPQQYDGESCRLYRNRDGRDFEDMTRTAGVYRPEGKSLGVAVEDFNQDGWPDIVVANDTYQNFLYLNDGTGAFTDVAVAAGVAFDEFGRARAGMGVDVADVTGQGRLSIAIGNFSNEPVSLYTQIGEQVFQDLAGSARITRSTLLPLTFGLAFADLNSDGYVDLVTGNGHIEPEVNAVMRDVTFAQRPQLFQNTGQGQFEDVSDVVGESFQEPMVGRGIATADYDRDGDLDVIITANGGRPRLLRNDLPSRTAAWIRVKLVARPPNRSAVGAVVTVYAGDLVQRRMVRAGSSYLSQSESNPLLFGLGSLDSADSVRVRWPTSGLEELYGSVPSGTTLDLREGEGTSGRGGQEEE